MLGFFEPLDLCRVQELITVSEWANDFRRLSQESSAEYGSFNTRRAPHQKEMMDVLNDPRYEKVIFMTSAQVGKTEMINNLIGYIIDRDPGPILLAQPNIKMAETWSRDRLAPMIRDTPVLRDKIIDVRGVRSVEDANVNTVLNKSFPGGRITVIGSNSPSGFAARPIRYFFCDELDLWDSSAGKNGDQLSLGIDRTQTFWNRKIVIASTPGLKATSRLEREYEESDQRKRFLPCPHCSEYQTLEWENMRWRTGEPSTAHFVCVACKEEIHEKDKLWMLAAGEWRKQNDTSKVAGFMIWAAYSTFPGASWEIIVNKYELAVKKGSEALQAFHNTVLGRTWEEPGDAPEWADLAARSDDYQPFSIPDDVYFLTAGADVQSNRIEVDIYGWGKYEESWLIGHVVIYGNPESEQGVWTDLDRLLLRTFRQEASRREIGISLTCLDSGHATHEVYNFCRTRPYVRAIKGSSNIDAPFIGHPTKRDVSWKGKMVEAGVSLWTVGVGKLKDAVYSRLKVPIPGPRYMHFCAGLDILWYQGLCAEKKVTVYKKGYPKVEWRKIFERNEPLDNSAYAYAAAIMLGIQWMSWEKLPSPSQMGEEMRKLESKSKSANIQQKPKPRSAVDRFLGRG